MGKWRSDQKLPNGGRNSLTVEDDLTGKATVYATPVYDHNLWVKFKFKIEGEEKDDGYRFDFKMECTSSTDGVCVASFDMDCKVYDGDDNNGLDKANCKGKGLWVDYPFDWERDED